MKRCFPCALLLAAACNSTTPTAASGEFTAPTGIGATGAGDRDLVFIANTGGNGLRALQLCNAPLLLDGGVDPADTCPAKENGQFIPAPIRVFPATIETGERPLRVAGVRLKRADGSAAGVALAVGADSTVAVVDARSLADTVRNPGVAPRPIERLDGGSRTIDVVAANPVDPELDIEISAPPATPVTAFVATETELLVLDVGLDATTGFAQKPSDPLRCTLAPVVPTRLAVVPGSSAQVYVADGAGDGVVSIDTSSITSRVPGAVPCTLTNRIGAGGRSVRSISLSPRWYETSAGATVTHQPGELLLMVLEPLATPQPGKDLDPGGVIFALTGIPGGRIVPIPPFGLQETGQEAMQPLALGGPGLTREGTFLRAVKPRTTPLAPDLKLCAAAPCTPLYVGQPADTPSHSFNLLAAVSATDGFTYFIDVLSRRFVNRSSYPGPGDTLIAPTPTVDTATPTLSPAATNPPLLTIDTATFEPGVTHKSSWRAAWHAPIPGLERRGGTLTPTGRGTLALTIAATNLQLWQNDPAIALAVGDLVSFGAYFIAGDGSAPCQAVVRDETAYRFELPIVAIPNSSTLELGELADNGSVRGFHPNDCTALGVVAEVRTGGTQPWLVFDGSTVKGRAQPDVSFIARQRRFDYPRPSYSSPISPPVAANDTAFTFKITGTPPTVPRSVFTWNTGNGEDILSYTDTTAVGTGLATTVHAYSSPRHQSLLFTSVTGSNEVVQADPGVLFSVSGGLVTYR